MNAYELIVGLEIHIQLNTESKLFTADFNKFGASANTNISEITLALPGILPKINEKAIEKAIVMGLATNCTIANSCYFDRKNYFYPDLPKGFQTTQDNKPICTNGHLDIDLEQGTKRIRINRIHMEEDAGKSIHDIDEKYSLIDLNRAGTPLLELVTEPDIRSAEEAYQFVTDIRQIAQFMDVSDGNMQEGSLRCDANVSIRQKGETELRNRVEIKNLNSIRFIKKAIEGEFERQVKIYESGAEVKQETRGYNANLNQTFAQRDKEMAFDYRYFPEPDLCPIAINASDIEEIKAKMPKLPKEIRNYLIENYKISHYDAQVIGSELALVNYFKTICSTTNNYKQAANWVIGTIKANLNERNISIDAFELPAEKIAEVINLIENEKISQSIASKTLFAEMLKNPNASVESLINALNIGLNTNDSWLDDIISEVLNELSDKVIAYKKGKKGLMGY